MTRSCFHNQKGQSLVQVMVAATIMAIVMLSMMSLQANQAKENRAIVEKLGALDFQQELIRIFADGSLCTSLLTLPSPQRFNSSGSAPGSANPPSITLPHTQIPINASPGAPPFATAGRLASPIARTLFVANGRPFRLTDIVGSSSGGIGHYSANFSVDFDHSQLIRALQPASVKISLQTVSAGVNETITACASGYGVQIRSGRVTQGDTVPTISGFPRNKCQLSVSIEDAHVAPDYTSSDGDPGQWGDNHYGGAQAFYDANWRVTCRFLFSFASWWDFSTSTFQSPQGPRWVDSWCRYLLICVQ